MGANRAMAAYPEDWDFSVCRCRVLVTLGNEWTRKTQGPLKKKNYPQDANRGLEMFSLGTSSMGPATISMEWGYAIPLLRR